MVDFALEEAQRRRRRNKHFRALLVTLPGPIMMTTLAALFRRTAIGVIWRETVRLRQPLGITIVGSFGHESQL